MEHMPEHIRTLWMEKCKQLDKKLAEIGLAGKFKTCKKSMGTDVDWHQEFQFDPVHLKKCVRKKDDKQMEKALEHMIEYRNNYEMKPSETYVFEMDLDEEQFGIYLPQSALGWEQERYQKLQGEKALTAEHIQQLKEGMEQRVFEQKLVEISLQQVFQPMQALKVVKRLLRLQMQERQSHRVFVEIYLEAKMEDVVEEARNFFRDLPPH